MKNIFYIVFSTMALSAFAPAQAQATRTWVSGVGDDANPCSRTAPCKTFAGAISKTAAGGEIDALDPGGFGAVTITKAITLDGGGQVSSVLVSGTNGIVINAGVGDDVIIRNLSINGVGSGIDGVRFNSGKSLRLQNVRIDRFTANCVGIQPSNSATKTLIIDSVLSNCTNGLFAGGSSGPKVTIERSRMVLNSSAAISADQSNTLVRLSNSTLVDNLIGLQVLNNANIGSYSNNRLIGNGTDGAPTLTYSSR